MVSIKICPNCGGVLEPVGERTGGFSGTKAVIGAVLVGPIGVAAGALGKKLITMECTSCGFTMEAAEGKIEQMPAYVQAIESIQKQPSQPEDKNVTYLPVNYEEPVATLLLPAFRKPLLSDKDWEAQQKQSQAIAVGDGHILALKADGTVLAAGDNQKGQCDVSGWTDIVAVYAQQNTSFGLRADGTVVTAGPLENGMEKLKTWSDMKMLAFATYSNTPFAVGIKRDGSVHIAGDRLESVLDSKRAAGKDLIWKDKTRFIAAGKNIFLGITTGGKIKCVGIDYDGSRDRAIWEDVVAITCGMGCTYGIRKDGAILRAGFNKGDKMGSGSPLADSINLLTETMYVTDKMSHAQKESPILFELSWGVGVISASYHHFLAADGTVYERYEGQLDPEKWHDIVAIADCGGISAPMAGIRADGTLVTDGELEEAVKDWSGLYVAPGLRTTILRRIVERVEEDNQHWEEEQRRKWREQKKCQHCGGEFTFFGKKCKNCGIAKDY